MNQSENDPVKVLLDLALELEPHDQQSFAKLVDRCDTEVGQRLAAGLARFQSFDRLMEQSDALPRMLAEEGIVGRADLQTDPDLDANQPELPSPRPPAPATAQLPESIGGFTILERIGEGGQGTVFLARQSEPQRNIALKLTHGVNYWKHRELQFRFQREYQALALMNHHHIAQIYTTGVTPEGQPFFTMEFVDGVDLVSYCRTHGLGLKQRLELFLQVCEGVAHAHGKLVLHRDLKPANLLVTQTEHGRPMVKIIDFGVAKGLEGALTKETFETRAALIGTPEYMAPEQLAGNRDLDIRTDIYALGLILYELAADTKPFDFETDDLSWDEVLRRYREQTPPKPSSRPSNRIQAAGHALADLDAVVLKAIQKDPNLRYATVDAFLEDCRNVLTLKPVNAKAPSPLYLLQKFIRRNRLPVGAALLVLLSLVSALALTLMAKWQAQASENRAKRSFAALESFMTAPHELGANARVIDVLQVADMEAVESAEEDPEMAARIQTVLGNTYFALSHYGQAANYLEAARGFFTERLGPHHPDAVRASYFLARTLNRRGQTEEALALLQEVHKVQAGWSPTAEFTLETKALLASLHHAARRLDEAESLLGGVTALPASPAKAQCLTVLGQIHHVRKEPEAESLFREALSIQQSMLWQHHPNALATMSNLANHLRGRGQTQDAAALYRRLIEIRTEKLGPVHHLTLVSRRGLALCMVKAGRLQEAQALLEENLSLMDQDQGDHPDVRRNLLSLANVLTRRGDYAAAEAGLRRLLAGYTEDQLSQNRQALRAGSDLGHLLNQQGRFAEAIDQLEKTINNMARRPGGPTGMRVAAMMTLGQAFEGQKSYERAERVYNRALELNGRLEQPSNPAYFQAIRANNLIHLGRFQEAEQILKQSLDQTSGEKRRLEIQGFLKRLYEVTNNPTLKEADKGP